MLENADLINILCYCYFFGNKLVIAIFFGQELVIANLVEAMHLLNDPFGFEKR